MDIFLGKVTQQAMNYAIRSGITITAGYAIKQSSRLLKTVEGNEKEELQDLQERLDSKIRIISPAIDMIELISARGNTSLESAVSLTKSLRWEIQALGQRLSEAANTDARVRSGKVKSQEKMQHEMELKRVIQAIRKLLAKIEDAVPLINLAITASGASLSSSLPNTVSPSRLLQASTFLTAGDSQYSMDPSKPIQIGPTFTLSMYMLFLGHVRSQNEEDIRENTWKEVMHKASVRLMRVPLDSLYKLPDQEVPGSSPDYYNATSNRTPESRNSVEEANGYCRSNIDGEARADEYAYQLIIIEDLEDDRVHTFGDDEVHPGPYGNVDLAGIREFVPIHELSKIFYADTGKILNIGSDGEVNNPVLLLKRDMNAVPPRRLMERRGEEISYETEMNHVSDSGQPTKTNGPCNNRSQIALLNSNVTPTSSAPATPRKTNEIVSTSNPWRIPPDLDPEWLAFEVYTETSDSDIESDSETPSKSSRRSSIDPKIPSAMSHLKLRSPISAPPTPYLNSPHAASTTATPHLPPIRTSLSLLETLLRLLSLQQFQQAPHLSIPDELLTFFLSESASTGAATGDTEERKRRRDEARRRVGFDPYDESPIKRRGEDYQYQHPSNADGIENEDAWAAGGGGNGGESLAYTSPRFDEGYGTHDFVYPSSPSLSSFSSHQQQQQQRRAASESPLYSKSRRAAGTPDSAPGAPERRSKGWTPPVRWRGGMKEGRERRGSPLARRDEGVGRSPIRADEGEGGGKLEGKEGDGEGVEDSNDI